MNKRRSNILVLFSAIFLLFLTACGPNNVDPTFTPSLSATQTPATNVPTSTLTQILETEVPTATTTIFGVPERLIDPNGPWILDFNREDSIATIFNIDGPGKLNLNLPTEDENSTCFEEILYSAHSAATAFRSIQLPNSENPQLCLVHLPDGEVLHQIDLIGEDARQQIAVHEPDPSPLIGFFSPIVYELGEGIWSPDGRYLAFVGAMDGPSADVYLYDSVTDEIKQLTGGPDQEVLISWSPDSQNLLHSSAEEYDSRDSPIEENLWVVNLDGTIKHITVLGDSNSYFNISEWISNEVFISFGHQFESNPVNLSLINIQTGNIESINFDRFLDVVYEKEGHRLLITRGAAMGPDPEGSGLYKMDLESRNVNFIMEGIQRFWSIKNTLLYFSFFDYPQTTIFSSNGEIFYTINDTRIIPSASENGEWIIVTNKNYSEMVNTDTKSVTSWDIKCKYTYWLPDSSGFYCYEGWDDSIDIYFMSQESGWQPEKIDRIDATNLIFIQP